jgi:phosphatidylserine/phosphatidylglycerophosphate/cardiolipin synthase-like enzyme
VRVLVALLLLAGVARAEEVEVCFTPTQKCAPVIVREIASAQKSIRVLAYGFTAPAIEQALVDAHKRGVDVQIVLDRSNQTQKASGLSLMERIGIPARIDARHAIAHSKLIEIDDAVVIGGSYNYTTGAETRNAENVMVVRSAAVAAECVANWNLHFAHAKAPTP